jgi:hypothetical protein
MPPCAEPLCAALAAPGSDRCAVHARGLRRHHVPTDAENALRCVTCSYLIRDGHWYRLTAAGPTHLDSCPTKE